MPLSGPVLVPLSIISLCRALKWIISCGPYINLTSEEMIVH